MIAMTASDIMTVAIAAERYVAVHYPLDYNQVKSCSANFERRLFRRGTAQNYFFYSPQRHAHGECGLFLKKNLKGTYGKITKISLTVMKFPLLFGPPVVKTRGETVEGGKLQRGSAWMSDI